MILQAAVALPILVAIALAATGRLLPRVAVDVIAAGTVLALVALLVRMLGLRRPLVVWLGGWRPYGGEGVGIPLVADPMAVGLALLVAVLALFALVFSWRFFAEVQAIFHSLMLLFTGAMCAFVFTGDLFDAFVFFELMGVVAYVLTGYQAEEPRTVHGALNFGVTGSLGAYTTLTGIGLLYARTGELGFAAIGRGLAGQRDILVLTAFTLVSTGFLVKAAAVPFHFWLADAHAVAPTPVCVLFSGVMVELGVYAVARTYWATFDGVVPGAGAALAALGVAAAVLGAVMCVMQRHIKRLLAYSTVSHVGLLLIAVGTLDRDSLAGAAYYVLGHAGAKSALFLAAGALLNRHETVDEHALHGRGRAMPITGAVFLLGGLCLAGVPPSGAWAGKDMFDHAAQRLGWWWVAPAGLLSAALTGGAVLRVWLRVFRGRGRREAGGPGREDTETRPKLSALPLTMVAPGVVLVVAALGLGVAPGLGRWLTRASAIFTDREGYAAVVLDGRAPRVAAAPGATPGVGWALVAVALAAVFGAVAVRRRPHRAVRPVMSLLHRMHSGHVGDYVAWLAAGIAIFGSIAILS